MYYWAAHSSAPFITQHLAKPSAAATTTTTTTTTTTPPQQQSTTTTSRQDRPQSPPPASALARSHSTSRAARRLGRPLLRDHARTASTDSGTSSIRAAAVARGLQQPSHHADEEATVALDRGRDRGRPPHARLSSAAPSRWHHPNLGLWRSAASSPPVTGSDARQPPTASLHSSPDWPLPAAPSEQVALAHPLTTASSRPIPVPVPPPPQPASEPVPAEEPTRQEDRHQKQQQQQPYTAAGHPAEQPGKHIPIVPRLYTGAPPTSAATEAATAHASPTSPLTGSISPSIAALAAASGAHIPHTLASPTKTSFAQRISQHLSERRHHKQQISSPHTSPALPHQTQHQSQSRTQHRHNYAAMQPESSAIHKINNPFSRTDSTSSLAGATCLSAHTAMSSGDPPSSADGSGSGRRRNPLAKNFVNRNGRTYIADPNVLYPLPVDLQELHRQSMRTLMFFQIFGGPIANPTFRDRPPARVLDIGCGSGFWSMMCHRYWAKRGHPNIQFTGVDVVPLAAGAHGNTNDELDIATSPDKDMKWRFVQLDVRRTPWPFQDGEFDFLAMHEITMVATYDNTPKFMDECMRVMRPGGWIEVWDTDHIVRMLRPHVPTPSAGPRAGAPSVITGSKSGSGGVTVRSSDASEGSEENSDEDDSSEDEGESSSEEEEDENEAAARLGAYVMTANTPMSSPLNNYMVEYNSWVTKALESRSLSAAPCTVMNHLIMMEEGLTDCSARRLAVPFSEVKWEREGVGGVVTKDGKSYVATAAKGEGGGGGASSSGSSAVGVGGKGRALSPSQAALRHTALLTVVQLIQNLEPILREVSGKSQDEWDGWLGKMTNDLLKENGTSWGECLEMGAWWARKKGPREM